ncbi:MAG: NUDIX domain-containing protein [Planctomycetota bacterium]
MPHATVELIARALLIENGRVLVCQNLEKGYLYLPGGHVDAGETAERAVRRELIEECGLEIESCRPALVHEMAADGFQEINIVFHVERRPAEHGTPVQSNESHIGFEWLDLAAVVDADLRPTGIRAWIAAGGIAEGPAVPFVSET